MDWVSISGLATAGGTLALAVTTYASVRSANRAARSAELSLLAGLRPLLVASTELDPQIRVDFHDLRGVAVTGGGAAVEIVEDRLYLVISLKNVGAGIAVLHGGHVFAERRLTTVDPAPLDEFTRIRRDVYIPPGDVGYWQIAWRSDEPGRLEALAAVESGYLTVEVLYGDAEGGQRVVTRYGVDREERGWRVGTIRHWQLDRPDVRPRD